MRKMKKDEYMREKNFHNALEEQVRKK